VCVLANAWRPSSLAGRFRLTSPICLPIRVQLGGGLRKLRQATSSATDSGASGEFCQSGQTNSIWCARFWPAIQADWQNIQSNDAGCPVCLGESWSEPTTYGRSGGAKGGLASDRLLLPPLGGWVCADCKRAAGLGGGNRATFAPATPTPAVNLGLLARKIQRQIGALLAGRQPEPLNESNQPEGDGWPRPPTRAWPVQPPVQRSPLASGASFASQPDARNPEGAEEQPLSPPPTLLAGLVAALLLGGKRTCSPLGPGGWLCAVNWECARSAGGRGTCPIKLHSIRLSRRPPLIRPKAAAKTLAAGRSRSRRELRRAGLRV